MKKKLVTAAFAMTLLLTGCGSSDDDKNVSKNTGKEPLRLVWSAIMRRLTGRRRNRRKRVFPLAVPASVTVMMYVLHVRLQRISIVRSSSKRYPGTPAAGFGIR